MNLCCKKIVYLFAILFLVASCKSTKSKASFYKSEAFACYYHDKFNGRKTADGSVFSNSKLTAAHKTLSFGTKVEVTNLENNKSVIVVINDRGPFTKGMEIDLSQKAFMKISDNPNKGKLKVSIRILS